MWLRPWGLKEGFLIGAGLLVAGELLQLSSGDINWARFAWPLNIILLGVVLMVSVLIFLLRKKVYAFRFLGTYRCAIPALTYAVALTIIMGLTWQVPEGHPATDPIGLTRMTSFWPFVLIYLWVALVLGQVILLRAASFHWRDIPFMLNHLGLFTVLVTAPLGSADMRRVEMTAMKGLPEWRAVDKSGHIRQLPLSIKLLDFTIDEYPPKLMLTGKNSGVPLPIGKPETLLIDSTFRSGQLGEWSITLDKYIDAAAPEMSDDTTRFIPFTSSGAASAAHVTAKGPAGERQGWLTCGSYLFPHQVLALDDSVNLVMPQREPRRYVSRVQLFTESGKNVETSIEVNKPYSIDGWKIYQLSYDTQKGRWSDVSIFELVRDPWQPYVYAGIYMMLGGAVLMLLTSQKKRKEGES